MAVYTSSQTGSWGSASTWGGAGVPGDGDTVVIGTGHAVTLDSDRTIGTSPVAIDEWQLDIVGTGRLLLGSFKLTSKGAVRLGHGTEALPDRIIGGPSSGLLIDGSVNPTTMYLIQLGVDGSTSFTLSGLNLAGNAGSPASLGCVGGRARVSQ